MAIAFEIEKPDGEKLLVEYVEVSDMTLDELHVLKQVAGMSPIEVESARWQADPDAWRGLIAVAAGRVDETITPDELGSVNLYNVVEAVLAANEADAAEEEKPGPPAEEAAEPIEAADTSLSGDRSGTETTPERSGLQS